MLNIRNRFHGHGSLRFVYAKGQAVRGKYFVCKHSINHRRTTPRIAVVVSKKVVKSAVKRNRIRRRLYEALRQQLPVLRPQSDIVYIVTSAEILTISGEELQTAVNRSLTQAGLVRTDKN